MVRHPWSVVQRYLQNPPRHTRGGPLPSPAHWVSPVQFGWGRVSTTQAPWLQYFPAPHWGSAVHWGAQEPATQRLPLGHGALLEQPPPGAVGLQTPRSH